jgi:hypothetical protein
MGLLKLPPCKCHGGYDSYYGDSDFECEYEPEEGDFIEDCASCLCEWKEWGGRIDPRTNRKLPLIIAILLYGLPMTRTPKCGKCKTFKMLLEKNGGKEPVECRLGGYNDTRAEDWRGCQWFHGVWEKETELKIVHQTLSFQNQLGFLLHGKIT